MSVMDFISIVSFGLTVFLIGYNCGKDKGNGKNDDAGTNKTRK